MLTYSTSHTKGVIEVARAQKVARAFVAEVEWVELRDTFLALELHPEQVPNFTPPTSNKGQSYLNLREQLLALKVRQDLPQGILAQDIITELVGALAACVAVSDYSNHRSKP